MPLHARVQRFLTMIAAAETAQPAPTIEARRSGFLALMRQAASLTEAVPFWDTTIHGAEDRRPTRLYAPNGFDAPQGPGLLFFHGGGLVSGSIESHDGICRQLAIASRCRILSVEYRLAPEHPALAAVEDARSVADHVVKTASSFGIDPRKLAIGGDSVGASLAAAVTQSRTRGKASPFATQLLICPVLDIGLAGASRSAFATGYFLDRAAMARDLALCGLDQGDASNPVVSPLRAPDLSNLPPAIIHTAEYDPVRDDGENYAARLDAAGVPIRLTRHAGMIHLFYGFGRLIPYGAVTLNAIGAELAAALR